MNTRIFLIFFGKTFWFCKLYNFFNFCFFEIVFLVIFQGLVECKHRVKRHDKKSEEGRKTKESKVDKVLELVKTDKILDFIKRNQGIDKDAKEQLSKKKSKEVVKEEDPKVKAINFLVVCVEMCFQRSNVCGKYPTE